MPGARVEVPAISRSVSTDGRGSYVLGLPLELAAARLRLDVVASAPLFQSQSAAITFSGEPLEQSFTLPIAPLTVVLDPAGHHLGDADFTVGTTGDLTLPTEGPSYRLTFDVGDAISLASLFRQAELVLDAVGAQLNNPITFNGSLLGFVAEDGQNRSFPFPPTLFREQGNVIDITAVSSNAIQFIPDNLDDFEFFNLRLSLR